jgi:hypothetical protein
LGTSVSHKSFPAAKFALLPHFSVQISNPNQQMTWPMGKLLAELELAKAQK